MGPINCAPSPYVYLKDFIQNCVCSHKLKILHISNGMFILSPWPCPKGGTWNRARGKTT